MISQSLVVDDWFPFFKYWLESEFISILVSDGIKSDAPGRKFYLIICLVGKFVLCLLKNTPYLKEKCFLFVIIMFLPTWLDNFISKIYTEISQLWRQLILHHLHQKKSNCSPCTHRSDEKNRHLRRRRRIYMSGG